FHASTARAMQLWPPEPGPHVSLKSRPNELSFEDHHSQGGIRGSAWRRPDVLQRRRFVLHDVARYGGAPSAARRLMVAMFRAWSSRRPGVSHSTVHRRTRGWARMARKPASPMCPWPMWVWLSRRWPHGYRESFAWIRRSRHAMPRLRTSSKHAFAPSAVSRR